MKNILNLTLIIALLVACNETPKSDSNGSKIMEGILDEVTGKNEDINEKYDLLLKELSTKTLLTNEQLLEAFPKKLSNLSLDSQEPRISSDETAVGSFGDNTVRMEILDAAGKNVMGAIIPLKMLHLNKITSEYNNTIRYSKKERNGVLTFGTDRDEDTKSDFRSELRFLYDNRFYVTLEGKNMNTEELWAAMGIKNLSRFKDFN
ncbi:hypothetical protein [uncultured Maribacter sp.]|uniref:hypothetical protein n=1 Tax=uncultured Maribacter sp. TaxID=431308 RepID=UPI0030ECA825|tara:strand:- start:104364 stop:104978 length:615 start_codon:yes stop_codon:yes gene_type:complete